MKIFVAAVIAVFLAGAALAQPIGSAFTYQGHLTQTGSPANGQFDFEFELFDVASGVSRLPRPCCWRT